MSSRYGRRVLKAVRYAASVTALIVATAVSVSQEASANISTPPPAISVCGVLVVLVALNLPINLSLYGLALYAASRKLGKGIANFRLTQGPFLREIFSIVLCITLLGALIDYLFIYMLDYGEVDNIVFNPLAWSVAVVLVFASIYSISWLVIELRPKANLIISAAIAMLNPVGWALAAMEYWWPLAISAVSLVAAPFAVLLLRGWHSRAFPAKP